MSLRGYLVDRLLLKRPRFRRWLTRLIHGDHDRDVFLLHDRVRVNTIRENGYLRAARLGVTSSFYNDEAPVLMALAGLLPWADTVIDVGANVGIYSKLLHRFTSLYPSIEFHAFEADPETAQRLAATLADTRAHVYQVAVSDANTRLRFTRGAVSHVSTRSDLATSYQFGEYFEVEARRLDSFELRGRSLILKIDVEGQELPVLIGSEGLFSQERVLAVFLDGYGDKDRVAEFLISRGFDFYDGRTLQRVESLPYALLAVHKKCFEKRQRP